MGGEDSEIADTTREVILEGASWDRASIRRASAALDAVVRSLAPLRARRRPRPDRAGRRARDASSRSSWPAAAPPAGLADEYPGREAAAHDPGPPEQIDALIGMHYPREQVVHDPGRAGLSSSSQRDRTCVVTVPGLAALRRRGPRRPGRRSRPRRRLRPGPGDDAAAARCRAPSRRRRWLRRRAARPTHAGRGRPAGGDHLLAGRSGPGRPAGRGVRTAPFSPPIRIANPQSVEQSVLRPSLLGSLLPRCAPTCASATGC